MNLRRLSPLFALAVLALSSAVASASGSSASLASDSLSDSVESISDSVSGSSRSTKDALTLNEGDYRVVEIAADPARPGQTRLTLLGLDKTTLDQGFYLYVREASVRDAEVFPNAVVAVKARPFGVVVYGQDAAEPFALVLADSWRNRLDAEPVQL